MSKKDKNQNRFDIGDIVRLKSGGPKMTVSNIKKNRIEAIYFATDTILESTVQKNLRPEMLSPSV